jgi:hypothetical protein
MRTLPETSYEAKSANPQRGTWETLLRLRRFEEEFGGGRVVTWKQNFCHFEVMALAECAFA